MELKDIMHGSAIGKLLGATADGGVLTLKFALNRDGINFVDDLLNDSGEDESLTGACIALIDLTETLAESLKYMVDDGYENEQFKLESHLLCRVLDFFETVLCEA